MESMIYPSHSPTGLCKGQVLYDIRIARESE